MLLLTLFCCAIVLSSFVPGQILLTVNQSDSYVMNFGQIICVLATMLIVILCLCKVTIWIKYRLLSNNRKIEKATAKLLPLYERFLSGEDTSAEIGKLSKLFHNDKLYALLCLSTKNPIFSKLATELGLPMYRINELIAQKDYTQALEMLGKLANSTIVKAAKFECYTALQMFDEAKKLQYDPLRLAVMELQHDKDRLSNLRLLCKNNTDNTEYAYEYIQELIKQSQYKSAIDEILKRKDDIKVVELLLECFPGLTDLDRFTKVTQLLNSATKACIYVQANAALAAGLDNVAEECLLSSAEKYPVQSCIKLAKIAKAKQDYKQAMEWLERCGLEIKQK